MPRPALRSLLPTLPLGLLLTACGGTSDEADGNAGKTGVPTGVVGQYTVLEKEIAERGGQTTAGGYRVGYIAEAAEPWFQREHGGHGALVPDVAIRLEVLDGGGKVVQAQDLNFYHSTFFPYANNFSIPQAGTYTLRATLQPPAFLRHGASDEQQPSLSKPVAVTFADVALKTEN